jgi:hypothetical protein
VNYSLRRLALGAVLAGTTFAAAPALASAASTCSFDSHSHYVYIQDDSGSSTLHVSRNPQGLLMFADGTDVPGPCWDKSTLAAVGNTDTVYIQGPAIGKYDTIEYDQTNGPFAAPGAGTSEMKLYSMSTSSALYTLSVVGTTLGDTFRVGGKGSIDLNADGDVDVDETFGASAVVLNGNGGYDTFDGRGFGKLGPATVPEWMNGGSKDDTFYAGREHNHINGYGGADDFYLNANGYPDSFSGGEGYDRAFLDTTDIGDAEARIYPGH